MGRRIENEGPADAGPSETARHSARGMHPIRILFVSDLLEAEWCLSQLQAAEFNVQADVVADAVKAAEVLQRMKYRAVITCASASNETAFGTLAALQRHQSATPFIWIGGNAEPQIVRRYGNRVPTPRPTP